MNMTQMLSGIQMPLMRAIRTFSSLKIRVQFRVLKRRMRKVLMFHLSLKKPAFRIIQKPKKCTIAKEDCHWLILHLGQLIQKRVPGKILLQVTFLNLVVMLCCS